MRKLIILLAMSMLYWSCKTPQSTTASSDTGVSMNTLTPEADKPAWVHDAYPYQPARPRPNDLIHTKLNISFDWEKQWAFGKAELMFSPHFYPQNKVEIDAKGFDIKSITLKNIKGEILPVTYTYDSLIIRIDLGKTFTQEERFFVLIDYIARPNTLPKGGSMAITEDKGLYFINPLGKDQTKPRQIWTQGETQSNSCWFPTIDAPNEKMTQEIYITVDTNFTTVSNGYLVYSRINEDGTKTDYWRQEKPHAPYLTMMAIGEFATVNDHWNDMEVNYLVEPEYKEYADDIFGNTPEMIGFFSTLLNYPYPWDKYSQIVVRDYVSGAMENTSASIFMEQIQVDDRELIDENWDGIIAHELFHHWFGDLVTAESWSNLPLNESFANYSEYLWDEYKYGKDQADMNAVSEMDQYFRESNSKQEPMIRYRYLDKEDMFDSHSYAKGGRILHMLRDYVGDDAFFKSLNVYLTRNAFQAAEIHHLRLAFEEVTGEDLNWFFDQWFLRSGHPELTVEHRFDTAAQELVVSISQTQDLRYTPLYTLPTTFDFWVDGKRFREDIVIDEEKENYRFKCLKTPQAVLLDGKQVLLAKIKHRKTNAEYVNQYQLSDQYFAKFRALTYLSFPFRDAEKQMDDTTFEVFIQAIQDSFWGIRDLSLQKLENYDGSGNDRLFSILEKMAMTDEKSIVRAQAIYILAETFASRSAHIFEENISHRSYSVSAEALRGYLLSGGGSKDLYLKQFIDSDKPAYISVISEYLASNPDAKHVEWFSKKLDALENLSFDLLVNYASFLKALNNNELTAKGIEQIKQIGLNKDLPFWMKFGAYQALLVFDKNELAKNAIQEIVDAEEDERIKQMFQYFE